MTAPILRRRSIGRASASSTAPFDSRKPSGVVRASWSSTGTGSSAARTPSASAAGPMGGWLCGCLSGIAGVEGRRRIAAGGEPPVPVRLVNWADEEGARFGRSLFGSSAAAGSMRDQDELAKLTDRDGVTLPDAAGRYGVSLDRALDARSQ